MQVQGEESPIWGRLGAVGVPLGGQGEGSAVARDPPQDVGQGLQAFPHGGGRGPTRDAGWGLQSQPPTHRMWSRGPQDYPLGVQAEELSSSRGSGKRG